MLLNDSEEFSPASFNMYKVLQSCMEATSGVINLSLVVAANVFVVLPLAALVLYFSVQRRLQSSHLAASHSDHFTYYMICNVVLNFLGLALVCSGIIVDLTVLVDVGLFVFGSNLFAHMFFDTLTCAERYLAVVHPVTYRNLKNAKGVYTRYFAIGSFWLLSMTLAGVLYIINAQVMSFIVLAFTMVSVVVVFFCSLSVICVLIRPAPGKVGGVKKVDQSKLRALYIILMILVVMLIRMMVVLFIDFLYTLLQLDHKKMCDLIQPLYWSSLPSCVMPFVLFLQREGKTDFCCKNNKVHFVQKQTTTQLNGNSQ